MLTFDIASFKAINEPGTDRKYVSYKICIRQDHSVTDPNPSFLERRYTNFLDLYNALKKEFPASMAGVNFPKKVMMGNFNPELMTNRSTGFESLLERIAKESRLREATCTIDFFQIIELQEAKSLMSEKRYDAALSLLENIFTLLNKIYMDRSRVVLVALCRLVACGMGDTAELNFATLAGPSERWANLALKRFDGVSDSDLLSLYIPLMKSCIVIWKTLGKDYKPLENTLDNLKRRGMRVDNCPTLMCAVDKLDI